MNQFEKNLKNRYTYKSYKAHFLPVYRVALAMQAVLLLASCFFSANFLSAWFGFLGEYAIYTGFVASALIAGVIGVYTHKVLLYWSHERVIEPVSTTILVLAMSFNIYADFKGAENIGAGMAGVAPVDTKTNEIGGIYTPQIKSIDDKVFELETKNYYWCDPHGAAHRCSKAGFWIDPVKDIDVTADIEKLKVQRGELLGTMNTMLGNNSNAHSNALSTHSVKLTDSKAKMRFGSIVCTLFYILFSLWSHNYGLRAISSVNVSQPVKQPKPKKKKPARKQATIVDDNRDELTNDELNEELHALRESERNARGK